MRNSGRLYGPTGDIHRRVPHTLSDEERVSLLRQRVAQPDGIRHLLTIFSDYLIRIKPYHSDPGFGPASEACNSLIVELAAALKAFADYQPIDIKRLLGIRAEIKSTFREMNIRIDHRASNENTGAYLSLFNI